MVDSTIENLVELTTALVTDILVIVDDPAGSPLTKKITLTNLFLTYEGKASTITGIKTFGGAGDVGKLLIAGTTSGTTTLDATAIASGILTLPATTDTLVGKATTDTFTNKTLDVEDASNSLTQTTPVTGEYLRDNGTKFIASGLLVADLDTDPLARANHTGTQAISTLSDLDDGVVIFTNKSYDLGGTGNVLTGSTTEFNTALQSESFAFLSAANTFTGANIIDNATGLTFNNQGAGADPVLLANDAGQNLDITGGLQVSGTLTAGTYTGQTSIVTLGTIATGTWEGTTVAVNQGGTGVTTSTGTGNTVLSASPTFTGTVITADLDLAGNDLDNVQRIIHDLSTSGTDIDFSEDDLQEISISGSTTFTGTGYAIGLSKTVKLLDSGSGQTLAFPANWTFVGAKPTAIAASKTAILALVSYTASDTGVVCAYSEEE